MNPNKTTNPEVIAATDEVFEQQPVLPQQPSTGVAHTGAAQDEEGTVVPPSEEAEQPPSPLRDYVRELQKEYDEQQEEGKI